MRIVAACGIAAACLLLPACATVTRGTSQKFNIESTPSEAQVTLSTGENCVTPCHLKLKRKPGFTATVKKEGFETQEVKVKSKLGGGGAVAGAGNILLGGVVGGLVDGSNGSLNNLTPNPLQVTLVPVSSTPVAATAPAAVEGEAAAPAAPTSGANETATVATEQTPGQE